MLYYLRRLSRVGNRAPRNSGLRNPYQRDWVEEVLPEMFAIIKTGGKQFRVQNGDVIFVEKLNAAEGETVKFDVLLLDNDGETKIGTPLVEDANVTGKVLGHGKAAKILVYKYKSKKNYRRRAGHRQPFTKVEITIG